jgi:hypothetical protein
MSSFNTTTTGLLTAGALFLGAGIFYQGYASQRLAQAEQALRNIDLAKTRAITTQQRGEQYISLIADMAGKKIDRQEPLSVVSEFSPREISQLGSLLDKLYQRDGHFFLKRFQLAWRDADQQLGLPPRVALDIEGRKVLLFSDEVVAASSIPVETR